MRVIIVGAGYAGIGCALRLSRLAGRSLRVTLINAEPMFVERIRLHEQLCGARPRVVELASLFLGTDVGLRIGRVERIDLASRSLSLSRADGTESLSWDRLVLATGSRIACDKPGAREHAFRLDASSTRAFAEHLPELVRRRARVLVAGGGLTGIEAACELAESFPELRVQLVSRGRVAGDWSHAAREHVLARFRALRIHALENTEVHEVQAHALQTNQGVLAFDACIWSAGFAAHELGRETGLVVNGHAQVLTDAQLRSCSHPHVYAIGDAAVPSEPVGDPLPMGCKSALPMGVHAAENLVRELRGQPVLPLRYASPFFCVSLGRRDGLIQGRDADKSLRGPILRGAVAAWFKELVCRGTLWFLRWESARARWALGLRPSPARKLIAEVDSVG